ncbi:MAG TPA: Uma2 family endonuclease, partial [Pseudonocardiaceae bacterium]|nr:Uma2 family endonuclease [Pseudonocardiaceae bacterium]
MFPQQLFPQHPGEWTLDEVLALPEDQGYRLELVDGLIIISPCPTSGHQRALQRLQVAFGRASPAEFEPLPGINVVLNRQRLLIPDLVVTTVPGLDAVYCEGNDVLLAAEIISTWSRTYDLALKHQLYAEAGVPFFLIIDSTADPVSAICYELRSGEYQESARSDDGFLTMTRPFPVTVDLG